MDSWVFPSLPSSKIQSQRLASQAAKKKLTVPAALILIWSATA